MSTVGAAPNFLLSGPLITTWQPGTDASEGGRIQSFAGGLACSPLRLRMLSPTTHFLGPRIMH